MRPGIILLGLGANTCLIAPLSTSVYENIYRIPLCNINGRDACVVLSQIRVVDTKRLTKKIMVLENVLFEVIRKTIKDLL